MGDVKEAIGEITSRVRRKLAGSGELFGKQLNLLAVLAVESAATIDQGLIGNGVDLLLNGLSVFERQASEDVEMIIHDAKGDDFKAEEGGIASHEADELVLLEIVEKAMAFDEMAHAMVNDGSIIELDARDASELHKVLELLQMI